MNLVPQNINFVPKCQIYCRISAVKEQSWSQKTENCAKKTQNYTKNFLIELIEFAVSQSACYVIIVSTAIALDIPRAIVPD